MTDEEQRLQISPAQIEPGDYPEESLFEPQRYVQFFYPIMYHTMREADACTALYLLVYRNTLGNYFSKQSKTYKLCWKWPGHKEVAKTLKIKSGNPEQSISNTKRKLIKQLRLIEWEINNDVYVGPNVALMNTSTKVIDFLIEFIKSRPYFKFGTSRWLAAAEVFADDNDFGDCLQGVIEFERHTRELMSIKAPQRALVDITGKLSSTGAGSLKAPRKTEKTIHSEPIEHPTERLAKLRDTLKKLHIDAFPDYKPMKRDDENFLRAAKSIEYISKRSNDGYYSLAKKVVEFMQNEYSLRFTTDPHGGNYNEDFFLRFVEYEEIKL